MKLRLKEFHNGEFRDTKINGKKSSQLADLIQGSELTL